MAIVEFKCRAQHPALDGSLSLNFLLSISRCGAKARSLSLVNPASGSQQGLAIDKPAGYVIFLWPLWRNGSFGYGWSMLKKHSSSGLPVTKFRLGAQVLELGSWGVPGPPSKSGSHPRLVGPAHPTATTLQVNHAVDSPPAHTQASSTPPPDTHTTHLHNGAINTRRGTLTPLPLPHLHNTTTH